MNREVQRYLDLKAKESRSADNKDSYVNFSGGDDFNSQVEVTYDSQLSHDFEVS